MTVHFIGAGPGPADLLTLRGRELLGRCPVCLYAGSLVSPELLRFCPPGARLVDTAPLSLDEIEAEFLAAHRRGEDVARLHSGDLSLYSALAEQIRRLERHRIPYTLTPGVPAFAAAAAALGRELTVPEVAQSVVLTRLPGRASRMPPAERLAQFAESRATLVIHLGAGRLEAAVAELLPFYGPDCPAALAIRVGWPDERLIRTSLARLAAEAEACGVKRSALVLVGPALEAHGFPESALYRADYPRRFRGAGT
jgi:precorrin-4/cobalt-precorrin-4 C11-methyltransferase